MSSYTAIERTRLWRNNNRAAYNRYMHGYKHPSIVVMLGDPNEIWFERDDRKRRALIQATPIWADRYEIRRIYQKCVELNQKYPGTGFVVHHIVPITHRLVCGLHVHENLEIVSISRKKQLGRKFITPTQYR